MADRRRALVVSTGRDRGALAGVRALAQAGWHVGVGTPDGSGMLAASNACRARHPVPKPRRDGADFVAGVVRAVREGGYDVVLGGGDDWMAALSAYRDQVPVPVAHPPYPVVRTALDKVALGRQAAVVGLATPRTVLATEGALLSWQGPVVVKCRAHWTPGQTRPHRIDARLFPSATAARPQVARILGAGGQPVLQQPVRGHLGALVGLVRDGVLHGRVQQRTPRLWPTPNGMSARAETVPVEEPLAGRAAAMLARLGWEGLVELQFLTDEDGVPHLIDLNGRFYGSLALAESARPGLVDAWARAVLGEDVPPLADGEPGRRYAWWAGDLRRARVERRRGLAADVAETLRWGRGARHSVWDVRDLGPTWRLVRERLRGEVTAHEHEADESEAPASAAPATPAGRARSRAATARRSAA